MLQTFKTFHVWVLYLFIIAPFFFFQHFKIINVKKKKWILKKIKTSKSQRMFNLCLF